MAITTFEQFAHFYKILLNLCNSLITPRTRTYTRVNPTPTGLGFICISKINIIKSHKQNMKKLLIALSVILLTLSGCVKKNPDGSYPLQENCGHGNNPYSVVIDSCEYIIWEPHRMAHKGNCKFCEKRRRKDYEAFLDNIIIELY